MWHKLYKINIYLKIIVALFIVYITQAIIVPFSNEAAVYVPKRKKSKVWLWLSSKMIMIMCSIHQIMVWIERKCACTRKRKTEIKRKRNRYSSGKHRRLLSLSVVALAANAPIKTNCVRFDTDSAPVGIDNRCTGCISHVPEDFIGDLRDSTKSIKGFGGSRTSNIKIGTLSWRWLDDEGKEFKFLIPNSYFVPSGGVRLLSPQHWAKAQGQKGKLGYQGTISQTTSRDITLMWNDRKNKLTVPLTKESNVGTFHLAPGYAKYDEFCCMLAEGEDNLEMNPIIRNVERCRRQTFSITRR